MTDEMTATEKVVGLVMIEKEIAEEEVVGLVTTDETAEETNEGTSRKTVSGERTRLQTSFLASFSVRLCLKWNAATSDSNL